VILHGRIVEQVVDRDAIGAFHKEIVVTSGKVPLAMVRKRAAAGVGGGRSLAANGLPGMIAGAAAPSTGLDPAAAAAAATTAASPAAATAGGTLGGTLAPVLLVHGFGQNRYAWHLPARSFANHLAWAGFDVFNLDLRGHGRSRHLGAHRCSSVYDYIEEDLPAAIEEVHALSGKRPVWVVGHSLGGLVAYAAAPRLQGAIAGLASIGSPYQLSRGSLTLGAVSLFLRALEIAPIPNAPLPLAPVGLTMRLMHRFAESPLYPLPFRGWHAGSLEPHVLEQHFRLAFDRGALAEMTDLFAFDKGGALGRRQAEYIAQFEALDIPLLVIAGANDDLAPPAAVRPGFVRSRARDKTYRALPLGHIDLLVGRDAPLMTWSLVEGWLKKRAAA
jgi:pimeloyl-ACP methyl ester carboxylesterase